LEGNGTKELASRMEDSQRDQIQADHA
jgi:hypothetical protein